jgi:hypothetical protein
MRAEIHRRTQRGGASQDAAAAQPLADRTRGEEHISEATLYNWRRGARGKGALLPDGARGSAG